MDLDLTQTLVDTTTVAIVVALVQALKMTIYDLSARVLPAVSLAVACCVQVLRGLADYSIVDANTLAAALLTGLITGLAACGLWTGTRTVLGIVKKGNEDGVA